MLRQRESKCVRVNWQPIPHTRFDEGSLAGGDGLWRVLEYVCAAVREWPAKHAKHTK